jgi:hypothetical protein
MIELLSAADAARILGVTRRRVVELAAADPAFPASQPTPAGGHSWRRVAVQAWAAANPDRGPLHRGPELPLVGGRSPQVWKVANLAGAEAQALNHTWIGPEHLLAALVHPDCPGAARRCWHRWASLPSGLGRPASEASSTPSSPAATGSRPT